MDVDAQSGPDRPVDPVDPEGVVVALASDANFVMQLAVTLASLDAVEPAARIFVLHDGIVESARERVCSTLGAAARVTWIEVDGERVDDALLPDYLTRAALFRLLAPAVLPADVSRVIYLDADVVVRKPLGALMHYPLEGSTIAAVRDSGIPWLGSNHGVPWRDLGLAPSEPYFNSGVLVVDVERWESGQVAERCLALMKKHRFFHGDQGGLNALLHDDWTMLPVRWNVQTAHYFEQSLSWITEAPDELAAALRDPDVLHFTTSPHFGRARPWNVGCTHPRVDEWFAALDRTAWRQWRPQAGRPNLFRRAGGRIQKATRVLLQG